MHTPNKPLSRRTFTKTAMLAGATVASSSLSSQAADPEKRIRVGVIGCGSVSTKYLPVLVESPYAEVVSVCDIVYERARKSAKQHNVSNSYPNIEAMLEGAPFDFLVNLTDMQEHEHLNRKGLEAGLHVWSEKPIANSLPAGQDLLRLAQRKNLHLWGAPIPTESPQFAFMAKQISAGKLGRLAAAHATYGHGGPTWSAFFYEKDGGSLPDLGVYNLTSLTGLLGPAKSIMAMVNIVTPERTVRDKGQIKVEEEDNAMVLMNHGNGVISHVQTGFNYFNNHGHNGDKEARYTIEIKGSDGLMSMVGYDWAPKGIDLATKDAPVFKRYVTDAKGYKWQNGAAMAAEYLVTGKELLTTTEHALHVLEIITAARKSSATGKRIDLTSTFNWPVVS